MTRSMLQRRTPLERSKPMRRKSPRRVQRETAEDKAWKAWIHTRACVGQYIPGLHHWCPEDEVQQSHERNPVDADGRRKLTGASLKESNRRSVPMCWEIHRQWTEGSGIFQRWPVEERKRWFAEMVERENEAFDLAREGR